MFYVLSTNKTLFFVTINNSQLTCRNTAKAFEVCAYLACLNNTHQYAAPAISNIANAHLNQHGWTRFFPATPVHENLSRILQNFRGIFTVNSYRPVVGVVFRLYLNSYYFVIGHRPLLTIRFVYNFRSILKLDYLLLYHICCMIQVNHHYNSIK